MSSSNDIKTNIFGIFGKSIQILVSEVMVLDWLVLEMFDDDGYSICLLFLLSIRMVCEPWETLTEYIFLAHAYIINLVGLWYE